MHRTIASLMFRVLAVISNVAASVLVLLGALLAVLASAVSAEHVPLWKFGTTQYVLWLEVASGLLVAVGAFFAGKRRLLGVGILLLPAVLLVLVGGYLAATIWAAFVLVLFGLPLLVYKLSLKNSHVTKVA